jgi:hypothetical protein
MHIDVRTVAVCALLALSGSSLEAQQPAVTNFQAKATGPTSVDLSWTGAAGANGYVVQRALGTGPLERLTPNKLSDTRYTDAAAPAGSALRYRIRATFGNGQSSLSPIVAVTTPAASAPVATTAPPPNSVVVPGQPVTRMTRDPGVARQFVTVPPAPSAPAPAPPPAPTPAVTSGRYRVVANGFSVVQQAHSHHDDVYGGFVMLHFNRQNGELLDQDARHTKVLGDINGRVAGETVGGDFNRLRAGTANSSGGLKNGDSYPDPGHARLRDPNGAPPNRVTFPFEIWSGNLTNASDAVVILPSLWSRDGKLTKYDRWQSTELTSASQIWYDQAVQQALQQTSLGVVAPPDAITPNGDQKFLQIAQLLGAAALGGLGNPWALAFAFDPTSSDFPIGYNGRTGALPRRAIVLTREMIEQALASPKVPLNPTMVVPNYPAWILPYLDVPVGVIPVLLFDYVPPPGEPLRTAYVMYLQVERL